MIDPLKVDDLFYELYKQLESISSVRYKYELTFTFLSYLKPKCSLYESYIFPLIDKLPFYTAPVTWSGLEPSEITDNVELLEYIDDKIDLKSNCHRYAEKIDNLYKISISLYVILGDTDNAVTRIKSYSGISVNRVELDSDLVADRLRYFTDFLNAELERNQQSLDDSSQRKFNSLIQILERLLRKEAGTVLVPVTERYQHEDHVSYSYGRIRKLHITVYETTEKRDMFNRLFSVKKDSNIENANFTNALAASRNLLNENYPSIKSNYFSCNIQYEISDAVHNGESANLALASLWYTAVMEFLGLREKFVLSSGVCLTGSLTSNGDVLPVSKESVYLKAKAVFFSWSSVIVVPVQQAEQFVQEIEKLKSVYPKRKLDVVGVKNFKEIFYDRRVTNLEKKWYPKYLVEQSWKRKKDVIILSLIIAFAGIIFVSTFGPLDKNVVSVEYAGHQMILKNQYGSTVMKIDVGEETVRHQLQSQNLVRRPLALLADLTGDGINEVIYANRVSTDQIDDPMIVAYSIQNDSAIWKLPIKFRYNFPKQSAMLQTGMRVNEIGLIEADDGPKVIVNSSSAMYFHNLLIRINASDGLIEGEYVHPGRLDDMHLIDLTNDGENEIVLAGVNNAFWMAAVVVLKSDFENGYGPATQDYIPDGLPAMEHKHYLLVPKSIVGQHYNPVDKYNRGDLISYDSISRSFFVQIIEANRIFHQFDRDVLLLLYFDDKLKPIGVGTNDVYDIIARELYENGEIPFVPDFEYFEAFQDSILYWDGVEFSY